jgi:uroporphyrinogen decarboxylase
VGTTLQNLRRETEGKTSLIGFIGAPWTLAAYSVEGGQSKLCAKMKRLLLEQPAAANALLLHLSDALFTYAEYQIQSGAEIIQIFDSWAHHLSEAQFEALAKPHVASIVRKLADKYPQVPVVYFANGGSVFIDKQLDMGSTIASATSLALQVDWRTSMRTARQRVGPNVVLQGNVDPMVLLYGPEKNIRAAVRECIDQGSVFDDNSSSSSSIDSRSSSSGNSSGSSSGSSVRMRRGHVLNLGHGVEKDTPEAAVGAFVDEARSYCAAPRELEVRTQPQQR